MSPAKFSCLEMHCFKSAQYTYIPFIHAICHPLLSLTATYIASIVLDNFFCSENVAYDTVGNTLTMSKQVNVTCLDNIAYATTINTTKQDLTKDIATRHTVVYDEVSLMNN